MFPPDSPNGGRPVTALAAPNSIELIYSYGYEENSRSAPRVLLVARL
jgi:hypothetical protein